MNLLVVCESLDIGGGSIGQTKRLLFALKQKNKISLITTKLTEKQKELFSGIKIYDFVSGPGLGSAKFKCILSISNKKIKEILKKDKIDIIYNVHQSPIARKIRSVALDLGVPFVNHVHTPVGQMYSMLPAYLKFGIINPILDSYLMSGYCNSDCIILTGTYNKDMYLDFINKKKPVEIISNGVDTSKYKKNKNKSGLLKKYGLSNKKKVLLVSRYSKDKNLETVFEAYKNISGFELLIAGNEEIKNKLKQYFKNKNIIYLGQKSQEQLIELYSIADVLVLPSFIELESLVFLEAISCSLPVIISDSEENRTNQYVKEEDLVFETKNPKDLLKKTKFILKNDVLRRKYSKKYRGLAESLDFNCSVQKLEKLFKTIITKNKR